MASGPNVKGSMEKFLTDQDTRLTLVERRLAVAGGGGGGDVVLAPAFMTPTSVTGGTFDPVTGRINVTAGTTSIGIHGVFTAQYRAYKIVFGWYTGTANGLVLRLGQGFAQEQANVYEYSYVVNSGAAAAGNEVNAQTFWGLAASAQPGHAGEVTVFEPMTTEYTNNQKRYVATCTAYGNSSGSYGGIIGGRDTTAYDSFWIQNSSPGPGTSSTSGSWVMVVPIPTSSVPTGGGGSGGGATGSTHLVGDIWKIGDGSTPPPGTLLTDGRAVSRSQYAALFADIGTTYGAGDGSTTFNLPNLNGRRLTVPSTAPVTSFTMDNLFTAVPDSLHLMDGYEIRANVSTSSGSAKRMRLRAGGVDLSSAVYTFTRSYSNDGSTPTAGANANNVDRIYLTSANEVRILLRMQISRANTAAFTEFEWTVEGHSGGVTTLWTAGAGRYGANTAVDGFRIFDDGGSTMWGWMDVIPNGGSSTPSVIAYENINIQPPGTAGPGATYVAAELSASYKDGGPAIVRLRDGSQIGPLDWLGEYTPNGPRAVSLHSNGTGWQIGGQTDGWSNGGFRNLVLNTTVWDTYGHIQTDINWNNRIGFTKLTSGLVVGSGLLRAKGTPAGTQTIGTIADSALWPANKVIVPVENGDVAKCIVIDTNGVVRTNGALIADQYLSLDGIRYWAADSEATGNWIPIGSGGSSWGANFEPYDAPTWGTPSFYKDRFGFVWFAGLARIKVATSADNTNIVTLPATHRAVSEQHYRSTGNDGYAGIGAQTTNGLNWKTNSPGAVGGWISLNGAIITTTDATTINTWGSPQLLLNSWGNYGAGFPNLQWTRRGDGLVQLRGMATPGTWGASVANMVGFPELFPRSPRLILATIVNNQRARIDMTGNPERGGRAWGDLWAVTGSTSWCSFDSMCYLP